MKSPVTSSPEQDWKSIALGAALIVLIGFAVYLPALRAGFIWDDDDYVTANPLLTAPDGLRRIWFSLDSPSQYFPLTYTVFRVERSLWGLNPAGYHWVNLLLHSANALLLWRLLRRLNLPGAYLSAFVFALHPVHVESVAWVTELKNVLMLFFSLLTMILWTRFVLDETGLKFRSQKWLLYGGALLCYALALFSKTTACALPAALLLILWLKHKPIKWIRIAQIVPFLTLGLAMGLVSMWWERYHQGTQGATFALGFLERVLIASRAVWFYAGKLLWPSNLTFIYPHWTINSRDPLAYGWPLAIVVLGAVIILGRRFSGRGPETAVLFFVAMLAPTLGFIMLYTFRFSFVADHYQYAASIGPIVLVCAAFTAVCCKRSDQAPVFGIAAGCSVVLILATLTWRQCRTYHDVETLWRTTIARNPDCFLAHNNLGEILFRRGDYDAAIAEYERALRSSSNFTEALNNLGNALFEKGGTNAAILKYEAAIQSDPNYFEPHFNLGKALLEKGQIDQAIVQYRTAIALKPSHAAGHYNLANALLRKGEVDSAIGQYQQAVQIDRNYSEAHNNLANALVQKGLLDQAISHYESAIESGAANADAHRNLANLLVQKGRFDEAIPHYQQGLKIKPADASAHFNLATALLLKGRADEAVAHYKQGLELNPNDFSAHNNLGSVLLQKGQKEQAIAHFEKAVKLDPDSLKAHLNLGLAFLQAGRKDDARREFNEVLRLNPGFALPEAASRVLKE